MGIRLNFFIYPSVLYCFLFLIEKAITRTAARVAVITIPIGRPVCGGVGSFSTLSVFVALQSLHVNSFSPSASSVGSFVSYM